MKLIHEDLNDGFTQAIYYDEQTELYYELLRGSASRNTLEVYIGTDIYHDVFDYYDTKGNSYRMGQAVYECTSSTTYDIEAERPWDHIIEQIHSYIMRSAL